MKSLEINELRAKIKSLAEHNGSNNIVVFLTIQYYFLSLRHE